MTSKPKKIALLFHEADSDKSADSYAITPLSEIWKEDGHEVIRIFGTAKAVHADVILVHVDLSVVPERFFAYANSFSTALNSRVRNICKSTFSTNRVQPGDGYSGKVIVKTDLNSCGGPENRRLRRAQYPTFEKTRDYKVFDDPSLVPPEYFQTRDLIVEKFTPEMEGKYYCVRNYHFFGKNEFAIRMMSEDPIVNGGSRTEIERVEPHPDIVALRHKMEFDYGKFDYVIHEGKPVLVDINKTMGMRANGSLRDTSIFKELRRFRAEGMYSFFDKPGYGTIKKSTITVASMAGSNGAAPLLRF